MKGRDRDSDAGTGEGSTREGRRDRSGSDSEARRSGADRGDGGSVATLHRTVGNRAIQRLHRSGHLQASLAVSQPGDPREREAERVAEDVVGSPSPDSAAVGGSGSGGAAGDGAGSRGEAASDGRGERREERGSVQKDRGTARGGVPAARRIRPSKGQRSRRIAPPNGGDHARRSPSTGEGRRSAREGEAGGGSPDPEPRVRSATGGGGKPLDAGTRSYFEPRFGQDFSDVSVHTGSEADEAARSIGAEAFTMGTDVAFSRGSYEPSTASGKQLLAHELTHVVQQGGSEPTASPGGSDGVSRSVGDGSLRRSAEADELREEGGDEESVARSISRGGTPTVQRRAATTAGQGGASGGGASQQQWSTYTVQQGDYLISIADELGIEGGWRQLHAWNADEVPDPNLIHVGQELRVPSRYVDEGSGGDTSGGSLGWWSTGGGGSTGGSGGASSSAGGSGGASGSTGGSGGAGRGTGGRGGIGSEGMGSLRESAERTAGDAEKNGETAAEGGVISGPKDAGAFTRGPNDTSGEEEREDQNADEEDNNFIEVKVKMDGEQPEAEIAGGLEFGGPMLQPPPEKDFQFPMGAVGSIGAQVEASAKLGLKGKGTWENTGAGMYPGQLNGTVRGMVEGGVKLRGTVGAGLGIAEMANAGLEGDVIGEGKISAEVGPTLNLVQDETGSVVWTKSSLSLGSVEMKFEAKGVLKAGFFIELLSQKWDWKWKIASYMLAEGAMAFDVGKVDLGTWGVDLFDWNSDASKIEWFPPAEPKPAGAIDGMISWIANQEDDVARAMVKEAKESRMLERMSAEEKTKLMDQILDGGYVIPGVANESENRILDLLETAPSEEEARLLLIDAHYKDVGYAPDAGETVYEWIDGYVDGDQWDELASLVGGDGNDFFAPYCFQNPHSEEHAVSHHLYDAFIDHYREQGGMPAEESWL